MRPIKSWICYYITLLILLISQNGRAQFNEQFSDKELTLNPKWTGNLDLFTANKQYLESNFPSKGNGYISTQLSFSDSIAWNFDCGLTFGTTTATFVNIYLITDTENPINCNNGYYLSLKSGTVSLCKVKSKAATTLTTIPDISNTLSSIYQYIIKRKKGNWEIEISSGATLVQKRTYTENQPITPKGYFSFFCSLNTNTAISGFSSQYIEITSLKGESGGDTEDPDPNPEEPEEPDLPDTPDDDTSIPINVKAAVTLDSVTLRLLLNRSADLTRLRVELLNHDERPRFTTTYNGNEILITTQYPFVVGTEYTVLLSGIVDQTTGFATQCTKQFIYYPTIVQRSPLRISELMLNPNGVKGIPSVEYVEIYNASSSAINLSGYGLLYGDKRYIIPAHTLPSHEYAVLTHEKNANLFASELRVIPLLSFPVLNNTSKTIGISNPVRQSLQKFSYSNTWYGSNLYSQGGYSLECIDLNNPLDDATNWSASTAPQGGTPGKKNSIERTNTDQTVARIIDISYPYNDQLRIQFSKEMNIAELQKPEYYKFYSNKIRVESTFASIQEPYVVTLFLNKALDETDRTTLSIEELVCRSGYPIIPLIDYPIALPTAPQIGDVMINELLSNPKEGGCDYIELYNRSTQMIDISDIMLSSRNSMGEIQYRKIITSDRIGLPPNHFLLLTTDTSWVAKEYGDKGSNNFRKIATMSSLNNKSGNIILLNRSIEILDEFAYNETYHTSVMKDKKGIALERLSTELPTQDPNNWGSASSSFRYGTPGYENSQRYDFKTSQRPFTLSPKLIVPNSGHRNDHLYIQYDLSADEHWVDIQICTLNAFIVKTICLRTPLSGKGLLTWDGKSDRGGRVRKGIYIVYIKTLNKKHIQKVYRYDVIVG